MTDEQKAEDLRRKGWTVYKGYTPTESFAAHVANAAQSLDLATHQREMGAEITKTAHENLMFIKSKSALFCTYPTRKEVK